MSPLRVQKIVCGVRTAKLQIGEKPRKEYNKTGAGVEEDEWRGLDHKKNIISPVTKTNDNWQSYNSF